MRERRQIIQLWKKEAASVLVTLVHAEGSSYRQPGARILIGMHGNYAGTISGGCLEEKLIRKAEWIVRNGAIVEQYSTMFDDTAEIPFGLGCGGVIGLLLEPLETPECQTLLKTLEEALDGTRATVLTWLPKETRKLQRAVLAASGNFIFASEGLTESELIRVRTAVLRDNEMLPEGIFLERIEAPQRLLVLGAGNDAKPLVSMASLLGWSVTVMDGRRQLTIAERFPEAERVLPATSASMEIFNISHDDAVVLMTHSYEQDLELLATILPLRPKYLGLLGARHRSSLLVNEVATMLGLPIADCCQQIYAPVGLDLGGDGPQAIALAVIAEIQACCMGKLGNSRRLSPEDVKRHVGEGEISRYRLARCARDIT